MYVHERNAILMLQQICVFVGISELILLSVRGYMQKRSQSGIPFVAQLSAVRKDADVILRERKREREKKKDLLERCVCVLILQYRSR